MIRLLQSNNMLRLVEVFVAEHETAPVDPFEPVTVVVQSSGMGQWLKLRLADSQGIAANVACVLPAEMIWQLYDVLLDEPLPATSPFASEKLNWHLMQLLPQCTTAGYEQVQAFLAGSGDTQVRQYQLAEKIAAAYDQYLVYRPEWITAWETSGEAAPNGWQADLWRRVTERPSLANMHHRAHLHRSLLARLETLTAPPPGLPSRLSVFGLSSLPPMHLATFQALSRWIDIDLYFMNPCQHYWGDIVSEKDTARRSLKRLLDKAQPVVEDDYLEVGNPLLSSMGKQGREYLELLLDVDEMEIFDAFEAPTGDNMLAFVQRDILNLTFGGEFGADREPSPQPPDPDDISIQVHACHSRMREVEILQDQLLRMIDRNPAIRPEDIIVMAPGIADYAPFIDAVFSRQQCYYSIADRPLNRESAILVAFMSLLSLTDMRLTGSEVMTLLEVPAIARKFELSDDDLLTLTNWIHESGIRWELDGESKRMRWQVPGTRQNTWQFGLDRLLLGYAMTSASGTFDGVLPCDLDAAEGELLGTLCRVVDLLAHYRNLLGDARPAPDWRETLLGLLDDFFSPAGQEELDLLILRDLLLQLEDDTTGTGFDAPLNANLVRYWLETQLADPRRARGFIGGGITFATLVPMRSIPFKVVCLMGMNDTEYPREDRPPGFDLMATQGYRKGDRSRRNDDRYLFLEALLSATEHFYISYQGKRQKDNQDRPPSVLVSELIDYVTRVFAADPVTIHPLQPFSDEYFSGRRPGLVSWREDWFQAISQPLSARPFVARPLAGDDELVADTLDKLTQFFRHPARGFLRNRLQVYFDEEAVELEDTETFDLDNLARYDLAQSALGVMLAGESIDAWQERMLASGRLMTGEPGTVQLRRELDKARLIFDALAPHVAAGPAQLQDTLTLPGVGHPLAGSLDNLYGDALVDYRTGQLRQRQLLDMWIRQLFVNASGRPLHTIGIAARSNGRSVVKSVIHPVPPQDATDMLARLIALYNDGMKAPLPFLPETSFAYVEALTARDEAHAREAGVAAWARESRDKDYLRLYQFPRDFSPEFEALGLEIYTPLLARRETLK